jgi:hypothetical protein
MAAIHREIQLTVAPDRVWDVVRDIGNAHHRLFPGVLVDVQLEGGERVVTFANGLVVRELTLELNDELRRYSWTARGGLARHHNASLQVFENTDGSSRVVWITEVLPNDLRDAIGALVDAGASVMKKTLESATASTST